MNTLNFPDVNVWVALFWARHMHSEKARSWFDQAAEEQFVFCRFTQIAVLRLLTTASIMGADVQTMRGAWKLWDRITEDDRIAFLSEPDELERGFRAASRLTSPSPKGWADAYLLGFATAANLKLITFNRALKDRGQQVLVL
jgi:toxin-antitoxin system PIN domain toxin